MKKTLHRSAVVALLASLGIQAGWASTAEPYSMSLAESQAVYAADEADVATKDLPYYQNFIFEQNDWKTIDASETPNDTWTYRNIYCPKSGFRNCVAMQNDKGGANDYYISPAFQLKAGKTYVVDMSYATFSYGGKLYLELGTSNSDVSTFTKIGTGENDGTNNEYESLYEFTVPSDGVYYLALHATNEGAEEAEYTYTYLLDFGLAEKPIETKALPYSVTFDADPTGDAGWSVVDKSLQAQTTWKFGSYTTFDGYKYGMGMQSDYGGGPNGAGPNDYLISPAYKFEAGKTYVIDMSYTTYQTGGDLGIELGTDKEDVSTFQNIATAQKDGNKYFPNDKFEFTVPETGVYYLGLHVTSKNAYAFTYVFDFGVAEKVVPDVEGTLPYSVTFDSADAFATWKTLDNSDVKGSSWTWTATNYDGKPAVNIGTDSKSSICDYLISPVFELKEGKTYTITADYAAPETNETSLILSVTQDKTDPQAFNNIDWIGSGALPAKDYETGEPKTSWDFEVRKDGKYYFAFQALNWAAATATDINIYSVNITEKTEEEEVMTLPYSVDFTPETSEARDKWVAFDRSSSEISQPWTYSSYGYQEYNNNWEPVGENHPAVASGNSWNGDADIYYASPAFNLEAGKTYEMTTETTNNKSCVEDGTSVFNVLLGTDRKVKDSYKTTIATLPLNTVYDERKGTYEFTVEETGNYYIAFHMYNEDGSKPYGYLFGFGLKAKGTTAINSISNIPANALVTVYSIDGRLASTTADLNNLAKGTYIVTVKADGKTQSFKVTK